MFARVSTYELEHGRASEAMTAFEPAIDGIRQLEGFVEGFFLVERDRAQRDDRDVVGVIRRDGAEPDRREPRAERGSQRGGSHGDGVVEFEVGLHTGVAEQPR